MPHPVNFIIEHPCIPAASESFTNYFDHICTLGTRVACGLEMLHSTYALYKTDVSVLIMDVRRARQKLVHTQLQLRIGMIGDLSVDANCGDVELTEQNETSPAATRVYCTGFSCERFADFETFPQW